MRIYTYIYLSLTILIDFLLSSIFLYIFDHKTVDASVHLHRKSKHNKNKIIIFFC